jgi:Trk-type K+ transport system membrane component
MPVISTFGTTVDPSSLSAKMTNVTDLFKPTADLHWVSRVVLTLEMWIGRLEILTVLVLLHRRVWRTTRWRLD